MRTMTKKLLISVAPLIATLAFAMVPTAAQAAPQWYSEGSKIEENGEKIPVVEWGNLTLKGAAELSCHNAIGGYVENPAGGGAGKDATEAFATWNCVANYECPAGSRPGAAPSELPWTGTLEEVSGKVRIQSAKTVGAGGTRVVIGCTAPHANEGSIAIGEVTAGTAFIVGKQVSQPLAPSGTKKGTSALHPGFAEFDVGTPGAGKLEAEGSEGGVVGTIEGTVKLLGFEHQEHIYVEKGTPPKVVEEELFGECNPGAPTLTFECGTKPVNYATGNETDSQTDLSVGGRGPGLMVTRAYNSQIAVKGEASPFGYGWTGPYSAHLVVNEGAATATVDQRNGSAIVFRLSGRTYSAGAWVQATLVKEASTYVYTLPDRSKLEFNGSGQLTKETDRNGNAIMLSYDSEKQLESATDGDGRKLTFKYTGGAQVESVTDPMGHTAKYAYEAGNLASVTLPGEVTPRWKFQYDSSHELTKVTDGRGFATTTEYEGSHRVIAQIDPMKRERKWKYATLAAGTETKITEPNGSETVEQFNSAGEPTKLTRAAGTAGAATTESEYNGSFDLIAKTDPNKHTTKYGYDATDDKTSETDPNGDETKWEYDANHDVTATTTPKGETTTIKRDSHGNPEAIERLVGGKTQRTTYKYDAEGELTEETNPLEGITEYEYDAAGDRESETNPDADKRTWKYNEDSQETSEVSPRGNAEGAEPSKYTTTIERDEQGRPIKVTDPLGHTTKDTYDADGNVQAVTDGNGHTTKYSYDEDDDRTKVEEPNKTTTETAYDSEGQMITRTDGNGNTSEYKRNLLEEIVEEVDPLKRKTKKEYDPAGNLKTVEDALKRTTTYAYDPSNRLTEVSYSSGKPAAVKYEYDKDSHVKKMTDGTGETTTTYDELDRLSESKDGAGSVVKYEYDLGSDPIKITYPNGKAVTRVYDKASRLEAVTDWNSKTTKFSYDPDSELTATSFPAGTEAEDKYAYNEADQMTEVKMDKGATTLGSLTYTRDGDGQVKTTTSKGLPDEEASEYTYDESNRLTKAGSTAYEYDKANNPTKIGSGSYTYNSADELEGGPGAKYTYNEVGQRSKTTRTSGPATAYGYDQAGNLTSVERLEEGATAKVEDSYAYNGDNLRTSETISKVTGQLVWDTAESLPLLLDDPVAQTRCGRARADLKKGSKRAKRGGPKQCKPGWHPRSRSYGHHNKGGASVGRGAAAKPAFSETEANSYIYGAEDLPIEQINNKNEALYLHHDQQGSTRLLTNSSGEAAAAYTYDAYGNLTASTGTASTPLRYDGQYTSADTGLVYLRARTYDPTTAQFLSVDPALATTSEPYTYTKDNPANGADPTGENPANGAAPRGGCPGLNRKLRCKRLATEIALLPRWAAQQRRKAKAELATSNGFLAMIENGWFTGEADKIYLKEAERYSRLAGAAIAWANYYERRAEAARRVWLRLCTNPV
jgi:RHS repeat-associated protein